MSIITRQTRLDKGTIERYKKDDGSITAKVRLSKVGVFPYKYSDGRVVMEAKLPEELFKQSTIDSANGSVVTDNHPKNLVNTDNYQLLIKGTISKVNSDGDYLVGVEKLLDKNLINKLDSGEQLEVSIGFTQETDWTSGTFRGEKYDCIQRNIEINHVAHVDAGRAGSDVRILLDSIDGQDYAIEENYNKELLAIMGNEKKLTYRLDGKDYQIDKPVMDYLDKIKKDMDEMKSESKDETKTTDEEIPTAEPEITGEVAMEKIKRAEMAMKLIQEKFGFSSIEEVMKVLEAQKALIEGLKSQVQASPVEVEAMVEDSIRVIRNAENLKIKTDGLKISDIKKEIIKKAIPTMKIDSLDSIGLELVYKTALEVSKGLVSKNDSDIEKRYDSEAEKILEDAKFNYHNRGKK